MAQPIYRDIPILLIDIVDFSQRSSIEVRRELLRALQLILNAGARFFMPFGNPWEKWQRHGTGDGYYFLFDGKLGACVALEYALAIERGLTEYNGEVSGEFVIRLRMVLVHGDVEIEGDQYLSDRFTEAERFSSYQPFKEFSRSRVDPVALSASALFHHKRSIDGDGNRQFPHLAVLPWRPMTVVDKHSQSYNGFVLGGDFSDRPPTAAPSLPALRIAILVAHGISEPLPEALELAKLAVIDLEKSSRALRVHVDQATVTGLRRVAQNGCDVLIFYGHGTTERKLVFIDGHKDYAQLSTTPDLEAFWKTLTGAIVFACHGSGFAADLPCAWLAFDIPILKEAPKAFIHPFVRLLESNRLDTALRAAIDECRNESGDDPDKFHNHVVFSKISWPSLSGRLTGNHPRVADYLRAF